jgi:hypothetical protein
MGHDRFALLEDAAELTRCCESRRSGRVAEAHGPALFIGGVERAHFAEPFRVAFARLEQATHRAATEPAARDLALGWAGP